jgi:hypothetical protein
MLYITFKKWYSTIINEVIMDKFYVMLVDVSSFFMVIVISLLPICKSKMRFER